MLSKILIVLLLLFTIFVNSNAQVAYATDVVGFLTPSQFSCFKSSGYDAVFAQIYSPMNGGSVDIYGTKNVIYAHQVGLATEVYISPAPQSSKGCYAQFDEAYNQLTTANVNVGSIWLKVTKPLLWNQNASYNINFIRDMLNRARSYNVTLGIYTNWYDWDQITGSTPAFLLDFLPLWYWNAQGYGYSAESQSDFGDYIKFGSWHWQNPIVKTYGLVEWSCSAVISKIIYNIPNNYLELLRNKNLTQPLAGSAII